MPMLNIEFIEHDFKCGLILLNMKFSEKSHFLKGLLPFLDKNGSYDFIIHCDIDEKAKLEIFYLKDILSIRWRFIRFKGTF